MPYGTIARVLGFSKRDGSELDPVRHLELTPLLQTDIGAGGLLNEKGYVFLEQQSLTF
jgi:hypothetical protein